MKKYAEGYWGHIFDQESGETGTKIVIDLENEKLLSVHVQRNRSISDSYTQASAAEFDDVKDSIINANEDVFVRPEEYGLSVSDTIPEWSLNKKNRSHEHASISFGK